MVSGKVKTRAHQLASLQVAVPAVTPSANKNESEWRIQLVNPKLQPICSMLIDLPDGFPDTAAPIISLSHPMKHPWINTDGLVTGHPHIGVGWNNRCDLGVVILDTVREFQLHPPHSAMDYTPAGGSYEHVVVTRPICPSETSILDQMSNAELEFLDVNPDALDLTIWEHREIQPMMAELTKLRACNEKMAHSNLSLKGQLTEQESTIKTEMECLREQKDKADALVNKRNQLLERHSLQYLLDELSSSASEHKKESQEIYRKWKNREITWQKFEQQYFTEISAYHRKAAMKDLLDYQTEISK